MKRSHENPTRRRAVPTAAAALLALALALVVVWLPIRADAVSCGKHVYETTPSYESNRTAYMFSSGEWLTVEAAWGNYQTVGTTGSCQDVNHRNLNEFSWARAMYYSSTYSRWVHGEAEWVGGLQNVWIITITFLPNGTPYRPATAFTSVSIEVAT